MAIARINFWDEATPGQKEVLGRVAAGSLRNSKYTLSAGPSAEEFHDLDSFVTGRDGRTTDKPGSLGSQDRTEFIDHLAKAISRLVETYRVDRLAFIEKGDVRGPVGLLTFMNAVIERTNAAAVIVRLGRKLPSSKLKGRTIEPGEAFLVLSDVATSGETIADAAKVIWQHGGRVPVALAVYDREQGATDNLRGIDIDLCALYNHSNVRSMRLTDIDSFEVIERDFGGRSITT